jgi:hypothetical protein
MELLPQDEVDLFSYVLGFEIYEVICSPECIKRIPDIIKRAGTRFSVTVYRGHKGNRSTIEFNEGDKNFISTSMDKETAKGRFSEIVRRSDGYDYYDEVKCCLFKINLRNALGINLSNISFKRVLSGKLDHLLTFNRGKFKNDKHYTEKFKDFIQEQEILVLGGGTFYENQALTRPGFKKIDDRQGIYETWYVDKSAPAGDAIIWDDWIQSNKDKIVNLELNDKPNVKTNITAKIIRLTKVFVEFEIDQETSKKLQDAGYLKIREYKSGEGRRIENDEAGYKQVFIDEFTKFLDGRIYRIALYVPTELIENKKVIIQDKTAITAAPSTVKPAIKASPSTVKHSDLKEGMVVTFDRSSVDIDKWKRLKQKSIRSPNYTSAEDWYKRRIGRLENVPIKIKGYARVQHDGDGYAGPEITYTQHLKVENLDGSIKEYLDEEWFDPNNTNAFKVIENNTPAPTAGSMRRLSTKSRNIRNTRRGRKTRKTRLR